MGDYAAAQRAANRSPGTIRLHRHYLANLAERHRSPWSVTTRQLIAFVGQERWAAETRKSARAALCGFFRWAHGMGHIEDDPSTGLPTVSVPQGTPRPTPEHVIRQVIRDQPERTVFMVLLAAELGMRCAEIARVHVSDYTALPWRIGQPVIVRGELLIHGKGGKTRALPVVSERLAARLGAVTGWAFPNGRGAHLTPGHVSRLLSRALPLHYTAHQMRHRCGTVQYAATRDLLATGKFLGHSRPETTQRYVQLPADALAAQAAAATIAF